MRKTVLAAVMASAACGATTFANAASLNDIRIGGFGSVGVGYADNDVGYAGHYEKVGYKHDTLFGLQFDMQINDRASVTTQVVANGRYDFEPAFEVAYLSYEFDNFTMRGGKIRTPFYMYSDYLDIGYAYPMLRPNQEVYENMIVISSFTGIDALIPIDIAGTTLQLQPFVGQSQVEERDSGIFGHQTNLKDVMALAATWYGNDWVISGSFGEATTEAMSDSNPLSLVNLFEMNKEQTATFTAFGVQYNDGDWLFNAEAMCMELTGAFYDFESISAVLGYQVGSVMPYISAGTVSTTDNNDRSLFPEYLREYERTSYSVGFRWDYASNVAVKFDTTYADFHGATGGFMTNFTEDDTMVYSASVDFVF
ncbi:hypothetical protein HGP28_05535 [Vibrio sp. SM6]|uniref:Porin n=1 Tax=Vibrio agarilyticus TaxID=2726741 RepID=A0A7X8TQG3_9VIBR|nr:hypothetical protein [Vibrio agarilyticus]NLS12358.1 hypothetical protein [Vibrio agarilyticus]